MVKENWSEKMKEINVLEVAGVQSHVLYNQSNGYLKGLKNMTDLLYMQEKETVFYTMEHNKILRARVHELKKKQILLF